MRQGETPELHRAAPPRPQASFDFAREWARFVPIAQRPKLRAMQPTKGTERRTAARTRNTAPH